MVVPWWNESSQKSILVYQKNGQIMDQIVWGKLIFLGERTTSKFPSLDNNSIRSSLWSLDHQIGQWTDEESFPSTCKKIVAVRFAFDSGKLYQNLSCNIKAYSSWGKKLCVICFEKMCSVKSKTLQVHRSDSLWITLQSFDHQGSVQLRKCLRKWRILLQTRHEGVDESSNSKIFQFVTNSLCPKISRYSGRSNWRVRKQ